MSPVGCTVTDIKMKWFDMKMASKKCLAAPQSSMTATGGGQGKVCVTEMDGKINAIMGEVSVSGISTEDVLLDTDLHQPGCEDMANTPDSTGKYNKHRNPHFLFKCMYLLTDRIKIKITFISLILLLFFFLVKYFK